MQKVGVDGYPLCYVMTTRACACGAKKRFFCQKQCFLVKICTVYIAHCTESNWQICNHSQKRRICHESSKYAPDEIFWPFLFPPKACQAHPNYFLFFVFLCSKLICVYYSVLKPQIFFLRVSNIKINRLLLNMFLSVSCACHFFHVHVCWQKN